MEFVHVELKRDSWCTPRQKIRTPSDAVESILKMIQNLDKEVLAMITLATDGSVINASICSVGSINQSIVSTANILRVAILSGGSGIILIHNHPSGSTSVSNEDREVTRRVAIACNLIGVELLDHIVVGEYGAFCSIKEEYDECFSVRKNDYESLMIAERGEEKEMNNRQRIAIAAVKAELYTAEEAKKILENNEEFDLHTLSRWNQLGSFKVKDGEVGITTRLWRKKENGGFFLVQVILYAKDQLIEFE